jgi:leader peptidase (prepilin peptidase)/N-methyltransferase
VYFINPRGLGFGDVRLSALNGFMTGWLAIGNAFLGILLGVFLGAISSVLLLIFRIRGRKEAIPFGPFLALGAVLAVFGPLAVG